MFGRDTRSDTRRARSIIALVCVALLLVAANVVATRYLTARLDLTAERLYTLSPGTRLTLSHIDEPITLRLYYSPKLGESVPSFGVYAQRVRELLDQYVAEAHGKLRLETYDPPPFSDAEDRAVAFGLQGAPLNSQGEQVYFGLAGTNSTDDQQVIAFFSPERERFLEYDLTKLIHALAYPKRTVVALMTALPLNGDPMGVLQGRSSRPMAFLDQLRQTDDVEMLPPDADAIPAGTDVLMLVHPQNLPPKSLFAIDQFVLGGGKAVVFVDPMSELQSRGGERSKAPDSDLAPLFKAWGLQMLPNVVAADRRDARRVVVPTAGRGSAGQPMDYIAWLNLKASELNHQDVITADLKQITMATAGILEPLPGASTKFEPLISTTLEFDETAGREGRRAARCREPADPFQIRQHTLHAGRPHYRPGRDRFPRRPAKSRTKAQRAARGEAERGCCNSRFPAQIGPADQCRRGRRQRHARRPVLGPDGRFPRPAGRRTGRQQCRFRRQRD